MIMSKEAIQLLEDSKKDISIKDAITFVESVFMLKIVKLIKENEKEIVNAKNSQEISKQHELQIKDKTLVEILDLLLESDNSNTSPDILAS